MYLYLFLSRSRTEIVFDFLNLPTDLHVTQGLINQQSKSHSLQLINSSDDIKVAESKINTMLDQDTSLVNLSHASLKSSLMCEIKSVINIVRQNNDLIVWGLSRSATALSQQLPFLLTL